MQNVSVIITDTRVHIKESITCVNLSIKGMKAQKTC